MVLSACIDEFSRQPWRSLLLLCCVGLGGLMMTDRHHHFVAVAWALMLLAMMPVLLAQPIAHILRTTRRRRWIRTFVGFGAGYALVWMLVGPVFMALSRAVVGLAEDQLHAGLTAALLALAWSASPWHQRALNRGHRVRNLAVFGWRADRDAVAYGVVHGTWCVASCWAWMLVPLVLHVHHMTVMVLVTAIMLVERLAPPAWPVWRLPMPMRLVMNRFAHA
jgi:predicted metal-binding membrane protein